MLEPNSTYVLKTGATQGSQTFQRPPLSAVAVGTDENGNFVDASNQLNQELNYSANASLVYYGQNVENTVYYKNPEPPSGSPTYRTPTGVPTYYLSGGDYLPLEGSGVSISYDGSGYITSPLEAGSSAIYDETYTRIDQRVISAEIFYSDVEGTIVCSEPVKDVDGFPLSPDYANPLDNNEITNEIYDVFGIRVLRRKVTDVDTSKVIALSVKFDIADEWVDGTTKELYFRTIGKPIFLINSSVYFGNGSVTDGIVSEFKAAPGMLIFEAGTEQSDGFIFIHSYLDNHVTFNDSLQIVNRAYNIKIEVLREGLKLKVINAEYRIPYVYMNSDNTILSQGEFTFRTSTWSKSSGDTTQYLNAAYQSSSNIFTVGQTEYKTIKLSIGTEWPPGVSTSPCYGWENLFQYDSTGASKIYMSIKTHSNITDVTP